jgi:hypothetical protein
MQAWIGVLIGCCAALGVVGCAGTVDPDGARAWSRVGDASGGLRIGWAQADITPERPVLIAGQFHARISERTLDPLTATVLALESVGDAPAGSRVVMVSCDLIGIQDDLRDAVREHLRVLAPDLDPMAVLFNATHTHTAPTTVVRPRYRPDLGEQAAATRPYGLDLDVMPAREYVAFASQRIAEAVQTAWRNREPGGIAFGLGQAVVGHNRLMAYADGRSRMYGKTGDPAFRNPEGSEDHSLRAMMTYDRHSRLTGLVVNVACPSQVSEGLFEISADFWHDTRLELRRRFGNDVFVLAQAGAAGDQTPRLLIGPAAEQRMQKLAGRTPRQEIAVRIADAVAAVLPLAKKEVLWNPPLRHRVATLGLPRRIISPEDAAQARESAGKARESYEALLREAEANPGMRREARWYVPVSRAYGYWKRHERVVGRFAIQQAHPTFPVELHAVRLGPLAFATNPFELYLDYGFQMQTRSKAVQTFVVQLAGPGSYLPTERSIAGGGYGAVPASTETGPEGGRLLVDWTVQTINALWEE